MKKISKQGFLISDKERISILVKGNFEDDLKYIGINEYPFVLPRVFPNPKVPVRVSIDRLLK